MSEEKNIITEKNNVSLDNKTNNHNLKISTQITESQQSIKTQTNKYKYTYSNSTNNKIAQENSNITSISNNKNIKDTDTTNNKTTKNNKKIYINSKNYIKNGIVTANHSRQPPSPLEFEHKYETNYSINNISNVKYVNGNNKNISKINYTRNPDIKFINHEKSEKIIHTRNINKNKIIGNENDEKCQCDKNVTCTCGKRNNIQFYEGRAQNKNREINNYINLNNTNANSYINRDYYDNSNYLKTMHRMQKFENINVETYPVFFSDEDNSEANLKLIKNKRMVKYSSPYNDRNRENRSIKISRYSKEKNEIYNTIDDIRQKKLDNLNINKTIVKNVNRSMYLGNNDSTKKNHNFVSICHCSPNKNNLSTFSPEKNARISSKESNSKYKYNISIRNINVNKGMNRSISYERNRNNKNIYSLDEYEKYNAQRNNLSSYGKKDLKMQNAQNMQITQEEKLFHILVPIPPNQIEYSCNLQFSGKEKKKYTLEEINKMKKRKIIQKAEITENENKEINYNNVVNKEIIEKNKKTLKRPNWNKTNKTISENKLSYEFNDKKVKSPKKSKKNDLDMQHFEINIADNGRKFKGEMYIENSTIENEKQEKDPNSNLLLSPNQAFLLKADYPRRDWNNSSKLVSGRPFSIEGKPNQDSMEKIDENILIKEKNQKNDWNLSNNEAKEVNINLYHKKKRQNLSKEKVQPFFIKGKNKNWNYITQKENGSNLMFKGIEKEKVNEEEVIVNDDYNILDKTYLRHIRADIKKVHEISDESSSEYDVFKNFQAYGQTNDYRELIADSIKSFEEQKQKVIINQIKNYYPNGIETYKSSHSNIPGNKHIYREIITNVKEENDDNESQHNSKNELNDLKRDTIKDGYSKDNKTEFNSPKSETKYSYREEIVSLSPNKNYYNRIDYISSNMSNKSFNQSENAENINEALSNTNGNIPKQNEEIDNNLKNGNPTQPNLGINRNNLQNQNNLDFMEKSEQEIPKIQDEEAPIENNYNQEITEQSPRNQKKIKYICKIGVNNNKKQSNDFFKEKTYQIKEENIINSININMNHINNANSGIFHTIPTNVEDNYNHINNISYKLNQKEELNSPNNKEILKQNNLNENQINEMNNININNSGIINIDYLKKIKDINNLNYAKTQARDIEVSKSQEFQSSTSQHLNHFPNGQSNEYLIQSHSKNIIINSGNNNNISLNKLNSIPMNSGIYGNLIWNNSSSTSKQYYSKARESNENMIDNEINNTESDLNNNFSYNSYSFGAKPERKTKNKVKLLKP